ncbi:hypothetical protein MACH09_41150 [Vibrio sp. MACH09]|uniref:contact-dependent growth inhibition system immunity protein n=1 Tax=Vibrio sp. MACH09 TaxID=3025122 RepID=UPI0027901C24|nr:contact-dependent growth inhibition system immunity protein [Vibrio sp. MACH09]GLO63607.1 hypothetical protein MACH09_41150 [Vibrio sp. MACH09]
MSSVFKYLVESYFYQDWRYEYNSSKELIESFAMSEELDTVTKLKNELMTLSSTSVPPQDFINNLGGNFRPESEGQSVEEWILMVIEQLDKKNTQSN